MLFGISIYLRTSQPCYWNIPPPSKPSHYVFLTGCCLWCTLVSHSLSTETIASFSERESTGSLDMSQVRTGGDSSSNMKKANTSLTNPAKGPQFFRCYWLPIVNIRDPRREDHSPGIWEMKLRFVNIHAELVARLTNRFTCKSPIMLSHRFDYLSIDWSGVFLLSIVNTVSLLSTHPTLNNARELGNI